MKRKQKDLQQLGSSISHQTTTYIANSRLYTAIWLPLSSLVATLLVYLPSVSYPFQFDDLINIVKYFNIRSNSLSSLFFKNSRWISYWLNACYYHISPVHQRFDPFFYRLGNIIFHCCTGFLVFYVVWCLCSLATKKEFLQKYRSILAFFTSSIFLLHPVQTQTVSYVIQGQLEGLAGLSIMLITACFLTLCSQTGLMKQYNTVLLFLLAIAACGTKEIVIVTPLLLILVDWFFVAQGDWSTFKGRLWIHLTLCLLITSVYVYFLKPSYFFNIFTFHSDLPNNIGNVLTESPQERILPYYFCISQFKVLLHYIIIFIWPFSMSADYDWKLSKHFFSADCLIPLLMLIAIATYVYFRLMRNRTDIISFCVLWFFCALLPRSSFIPSTELLADYKTYIASFGVCLLFGLFLCKIVVILTKKSSTNAIYILSALLVVFLGQASYKRNKVWSSAEQFWLDVIQHAPQKARAYNNYGVDLCNRKLYEKSIYYFQQAIKLDPYYSDPHNNIAIAYTALKKIDLAIQSYKESIRLMPYHPEIYNNLASVLMENKEFDNVPSLLREAIKLRPHYGKAYYNLGNYYMRTNNNEKAWEAYKYCCTKADYDNTIGFGAYAKMSLVLKRYDDALYACTKLRDLSPESLEVHMSLAYVHNAMKNYEEAERIYKKLLLKVPEHKGVLFQLGEVYFAQGRYAHALTEYEAVKRIDPLFTPVYERIALCLLKCGRTREARSLLRMFLDQSPPEKYATKAREILKTIEK